MNSPVNVLLATNESVSSTVVAGGRFTQAGGVFASKIAAWDGVDWSPLAGGFGGVAPSVHALVRSGSAFGDVLFAGGQFTVVGGSAAFNVARWDGASWSALAGGVNGPVFALAVHDDGTGPALYIGGSFTEAGGVAALNVAKWNGTRWFGLGFGANDRVFAMVEYDDGAGDRLYIAGDFTMVGGVNAQRIACWNGPGWSAVGGGFNNSVFALCVYDNEQDADGPRLYAGGNFTQNGGAGVNRVARWDGGTWSGVGSGTNATVRAMTTFDDGTDAGPSLYVGGSFTLAGGNNANRIAQWDGSVWSGLDSGLNNTVFALVGAQRVSDVGSALYVGGSFTAAGELEANYVARWMGCAILPADMNGDGRLSAADVEPFTSCLTGPGGGVALSCTTADTDDDKDVDLADFARFSSSFTGP